MTEHRDLTRFLIFFDSKESKKLWIFVAERARGSFVALLHEPEFAGYLSDIVCKFAVFLFTVTTEEEATSAHLFRAGEEAFAGRLWFSTTAQTGHPTGLEITQIGVLLLGARWWSYHATEVPFEGLKREKVCLEVGFTILCLFRFNYSVPTLTTTSPTTTTFLTPISGRRWREWLNSLPGKPLITGDSPFILCAVRVQVVFYHNRYY